ncbi:MAG: hypothetical protein K2N73_10300 [Lachnospiraceae bacterium]|nr:hypothetical protein [Lachnospiraceae bacterium]
MDKEDAIKLFETVLTALACPFGLLPIMDGDATKDILKVHLKPEEPPIIPLKIPRYEPLYFHDTGLDKVPLPYLLVGMNDKIDTSKIVYVRLNEKHEPDGIVEVPESEV